MLKADPDLIVRYIEEKQNSSFYFSSNGEVLINTSPEVRRPLASTAKIMVAAAYAEEVANGNLNPGTAVSLEELERYYLEGTDGGAHPMWIAHLEAEPTLQDVAEGMITYSSNANTDYLLEIIGFETLDEKMEAWGVLAEHDRIVPIVSASLLVADMGESARDLDQETFRERAIYVHNQLSKGERFIAECERQPMKLQRIWSDKMASATASIYGQFLHGVQTDNWSNEKATAILRGLLELDIEDLTQGFKGGSTGFVLTFAFYGEGKDGERTELVILLDDLNQVQQARAESNLNDFMLGMVYNHDYREKVIERLK